jgi:dimethylhistidine N-methyltransferase
MPRFRRLLMAALKSSRPTNKVAQERPAVKSGERRRFLVGSYPEPFGRISRCAARTVSNTTAFRDDVLEGLSRSQKTIPCRWLYDSRGSELFESITRLPEYYPSRTEAAILSRHGQDLSDFVGSEAIVLEYGAGAGIKSRMLLSRLQRPRLYVPIDIAGEYLNDTAKRMRGDFSMLETWPVAADFTEEFELPTGLPSERRIAFFPGSTIGNLDDSEAGALLRLMRKHVGTEGAAIVGVDMTKNLDTLLSAYDDPAGVTAEFNLDLLSRINRELGGDFNLDLFAHQARWNARASAIEMHLVSKITQTIMVDDRRFDFEQTESIHTESSRKYDCQTFGALAADNGWSVGRTWTDERERFALFGLTPA